MGLTPVTSILKADEIKKQSESVQKHLEKALAYCKNVERKCTDFMSIHNETAPHRVPPNESSMDEIDTLNFLVRANLFAAYDTLVAPQTFHNQRSAGVAAVDDYLKYNDLIEKIFVAAQDNRLYIKLPLLWGRGRYKAWVKRHRVDYDYLHWFSRNLDSALTLIEETIPTYHMKSIQYLFVFEPSSRTSDSDNYDTKSISDTIVSHMLGDDSPLQCSFAYASTTSDKLSSGTYIVVSEGLDFSLSIEEQKSIWNTLLNR